MTKSEKLFQKALTLLPGGVNSPVRSFKSVGTAPVVISDAAGSKIYDVDGNSYIDYVMSWGPLILGHAHREVIAAISKTAKKGTSYGALTEIEIQLAALVRKMMPSVEMMRFVNSGTEATMSAIRLARAFTGRKKILKFRGCYHGHSDSFLVKAGSGALTFGVPDSPGIPDELAGLTLNAEYNDIASVEEILKANKEQIAAIIVEPVACNMGVVLPLDGFLGKLRSICDLEKILLIFDEIITGFRVAAGGAQEYFGVKPDLTCLGKIIGGGLPVGAYGGKKEIMQMISPSGPVYQAGTLSGNPLAMAAGYATLQILNNEKNNIYPLLKSKTHTLAKEISCIADRQGIEISVNHFASMMTLFFTGKKVVDFSVAASADTKRFSKYFILMLRNNIYLPPSQFEAMFVSSFHSDKDIEMTINAFKKIITKCS
ncbi:MAG: glutamate-1-semialdehyde 2,1-aminomutase [Bacteroidetes bacterium]|nr:glutamate-1-semialdehyde 2,1-aminomutase [Bacteroidota bacterium]